MRQSSATSKEINNRNDNQDNQMPKSAGNDRKLNQNDDHQQPDNRLGLLQQPGDLATRNK